MVVRCPAKINLFLSVGPVESSGYHPICTIFQTISLFDTITIEKSLSGRDTITCDWPDLPPENTVSKALRLAREFVEIPALRIHIAKRIPVQAGLGGGSSDAAGLLRSIDHFAPTALSMEAKVDIAAATGSDVPFFLVGGRALGEGRGDRLTPLPDLEPTEFTIIQPKGVSVSTALAYADLDRYELAIRRPLSISEHLCDGLMNDFERVMPAACGAAIDALLRAGAKCAHLCGSGSAVFGIGADRSHAALTSFESIWNCRALTREESLTLA